MSKLMKLSEVLSDIEQLPWSHALYMSFDSKWQLDSPCAVLDPDDCDDDEEVPAFAAQNNLNYALSIQDIKGIRNNAVAQRPDLSLNEFFDAFVYYYDKDAFLEF